MTERLAGRGVAMRLAFELEWFVARVDGNETTPIHRGPAYSAAVLAEISDYVDGDDAVLFLCRSGVRSHHAAHAAAQAGYARAYNILEGFEGDLDSSRKRGNSGGWRFAGLPWIQS